MPLKLNLQRAVLVTVLTAWDTQLFALDAVDVALTKLNSPYGWGDKGPDSFDCSGLTAFAYAQVGVTLPDGSQAQALVGTLVQGSPLESSTFRRGDLLFFDDDTTKGVVSHVGIYEGNDIMVSAAWNGRIRGDGSLDGFVVESNINAPYWIRTFMFARRVLSASNDPTVGALDRGAWPTAKSNNQRTSQAAVLGPASPLTVRVWFDARRPIYDPVGAPPMMIVAADGTVLLPSCTDQIRAFDRGGQPRWTYSLSGDATVRESARGLTADRAGRILAAVHDCPDVPGPVGVSGYAVSLEGTEIWTRPNRTAMYYAPAVIYDGTIYQDQELGAVEAFRPDGSPLWSTRIGGSPTDAVSVDHIGNLYAGYDSGPEEGIVSLDPTGGLRWRSVGGSVHYAIDAFNRLHVIDRRAQTLLLYDSDGNRQWSFAISRTVDYNAIALGSDGTTYVRTLQALLAVGPDGTLKWTVDSPAESGAVDGPVLDADENVYFVTSAGVSSVTARGEPRWSVPISDARGIIIGGPGRLYISAGMQQVYVVADANRVP